MYIFIFMKIEDGTETLNINSSHPSLLNSAHSALLFEMPFILHCMTREHVLYFQIPLHSYKPLTHTHLFAHTNLFTIALCINCVHFNKFSNV